MAFALAPALNKGPNQCLWFSLSVCNAGAVNASGLPVVETMQAVRRSAAVSNGPAAGLNLFVLLR